MKAFIVLCLAAAVAAAPIMEERRSEDNEVRDDDDGCGRSKVALSRIVGGSNARKGEYPWIASLRFRRSSTSASSHTCGCSIIDDKWILVAAHCFINSDKPDNYIVRVATYNQSAGANEPEAVEIEVDKVIKHSGFTMSLKIQNDIALLKLKKAVNFDSPYISRVCLPPTKTYNVDGQTLTVAGWGDTVNGNGKAIPDILKNTDLIAQTDKTCQNAWGSFMYNTAQMVCASAANTSPCVGDSGGPLMVTDSQGKRVQVGVVSFGDSSCAGPRPPVFTRVSNYLDWIETQKKAN